MTSYKKRKKPSQRLFIGREILKLVPEFHLEKAKECESVTTARWYVAANSIKPPALIHVKRNIHTTDVFYWSQKGMFGAAYAAYNYLNFPCLKKIADNVDKNSLLEKFEEYYIHFTDDQQEKFNLVFSYI